MVCFRYILFSPNKKFKERAFVLSLHSIMRRFSLGQSGENYHNLDRCCRMVVEERLRSKLL